MRVLSVVMMGWGMSLLAGCGGSGGIAGKPSDLPPEDFLEAPLSFGDLDNTSTCFRTQQLVFHITGFTKGWEWKQLDDANWEYTVPIHASGGREGSARLRLRRVGALVHAVEYEEIVNGSVFTHGKEPNMSGYVRSFRTTIIQSGAQPIAGCPDPAFADMRY